jgi:hypothetical protein
MHSTNCFINIHAVMATLYSFDISIIDVLSLQLLAVEKEAVM